MTCSSKQLLVTGASGFLGSSLVHLARQNGWKIRVFSRNPPRIERVETCVGDVGNAALLRKACEGISAIVHAAGLAHVLGPSARRSLEFDEVNDIGTGNVVDAAVDSGVQHVILVSSVSVYGPDCGASCDESTPCQPSDPYAISKWRGEVRAAERVANQSCALTILRFATMYGEGDRGNVARLIRALDRRRFVWPGAGENRKSLIYKDDAARACLCALERPVAGTSIFNVSQEPVTMREIVSEICLSLGRTNPRHWIPSQLLKTAGTVLRNCGDPGNVNQQLQKFVRDDVFSGVKFETTFGFMPAVSLSEGIRREVTFLRSQEKR